MRPMPRWLPELALLELDPVKFRDFVDLSHLLSQKFVKFCDGDVVLTDTAKGRLRWDWHDRGGERREAFRLMGDELFLWKHTEGENLSDLQERMDRVAVAEGPCIITVVRGDEVLSPAVTIWPRIWFCKKTGSRFEKGWTYCRIGFWPDVEVPREDRLPADRIVLEKEQYEKECARSRRSFSIPSYNTFITNPAFGRWDPDT